MTACLPDFKQLCSHPIEVFRFIAVKTAIAVLAATNSNVDSLSIVSFGEQLSFITP